MHPRKSEALHLISGSLTKANAFLTKANAFYFLSHMISCAIMRAEISVVIVLPRKRPPRLVTVEGVFA